MRINSEDLKVIFDRIYEFIDSYNNFDIKEDYYWDLAEEDRYLFESSPERKFEVGSLDDDITELLKLRKKDRIVTPVDLDRLAALLNKLSHTISKI